MPEESYIDHCSCENCKLTRIEKKIEGIIEKIEKINTARHESDHLNRFSKI